jgi:hypothetical protein
MLISKTVFPQVAMCLIKLMSVKLSLILFNLLFRKRYFLLVFVVSGIVTISELSI